MKKILKTLVILSVLTCAVPSFGCTQNQFGGVTGGACSISEIRNIEKSKNATEKTGLNPKGVRDLRPLRTIQEMPKSDDDECLFGRCLLKTLLGK